MARRNNKTVKISTVIDLPGAMFFGDIADEDLDFASRLQAIRHEYESTDDQCTLWDELSQMGFGSREISAYVANPAAITKCGYGLPCSSLR
jgi:hypothetical protein